ncbi:MAG: hypothetical protein GY801_48080 [bacterium]|nr:hypothetical protein [bacterium]
MLLTASAPEKYIPSSMIFLDAELAFMYPELFMNYTMMGQDAFVKRMAGVRHG